MVNYTSLAATAKRLIESNGRDVTLVRLSETPVIPSQPWRGTTTASTTVTAKAVIVAFLEEEVDGELIRRGDLRAVIAENSIVPSQPIEDFTLLRDDENQEWKILDVQKVRPGPVTIVYKLQIRK